MSATYQPDVSGLSSPTGAFIQLPTWITGTGNLADTPTPLWPGTFGASATESAASCDQVASDSELSELISASQRALRPWMDENPFE